MMPLKHHLEISQDPLEQESNRIDNHSIYKKQNYQLTKNIDIQDLVKQAKKGKWSAQKALYLYYADDMMSIAIRYTKDIPSAKDLVQDSFLSFFDKIDQLDLSKGMPGPWISRILINKALQNIRKEKRISFVEEQKFILQPSNEISIIEKLEAEDILILLQKLPEGCRIIFNLHVVEGYKHEEIGSMLSITSGASRSQLTRAKKILRKILEQNRTKTNLKIG